MDRIRRGISNYNQAPTAICGPRHRSGRQSLERMYR